MVSYFIDGWPFAAVRVEHSYNEVLELGWKVLDFVCFKESVNLSSPDHPIEAIASGCLLKWKLASDDGEQNHTERENINLRPIVLSFLMKFWSHVERRANGINQSFGLMLTWKSEVKKLDVQVIVDEHVVKFQVSVGDVLLV